MNTHSIVGRIGNDLELKSTSTGKKVLEFNVGVNDNQKQLDGTYKTFWFRVVAFEQKAEYISKYGYKGALVSLTTKPTVEDYKDKDGANRKAYKEIINEVSILSKKDETAHHEPVKAPQKPKVDISNVVDDESLDLPDGLTW